MTFSKLIKKTFLAATAVSVSCLGYTLKKGFDFNESIEKTSDTLDICNIGKKISITYPASPMKDLKIGSFFGTATIDLTHLSFEEIQYDLDLDIRASTLCMIIPENVLLNVTGRCIAGRVYNEVADPEQPVCTLSVYAKVYKGALCFKTPS